MSPADLEALGLRSGDLVEISSELDTITAVTEATDELQPGVISMAHCWGEVPSLQGDVRSTGSAVSRLIPTDRHFDPISGMPRFTAIPVKLRAGG